MESNMRQEMRQSWLNGYSDNCMDYEVPIINHNFQEGFEACHDILMPLIIEAYPHVLGNYGAAYFTDSPQLKKIDDLIERIEAVLPK